MLAVPKIYKRPREVIPPDDSIRGNSAHVDHFVSGKVIRSERELSSRLPEGPAFFPLDMIPTSQKSF